MDETYLTKLRLLLDLLDDSIGMMKQIESSPFVPNRLRLNVFDARNLIEVSREVLGKYALIDSVLT
ncbi:MAG: hypothetical protein MR717_09115 [Prevotella sp.]|nr:hypothetical protein [Prevotella sp.]